MFSYKDKTMNSANNNRTQDNSVTEKEILDSTKTKPDIPVQSIIRYWRNSLSDEQMMGISPKEMKKGKKVKLSQLESGQLSTDLFVDFFHKAEQKAREKQKKEAKFGIRGQYNKANHKEYLIKKMDFYIAPHTARKSYEHGTRKGVNTPPIEVFPLWMVCTLSRDGTLSASEELTFPWVERKCLTPSENIKGGLGYPIIGDISTLDQFYTRNPLGITPEEIESSWPKLFSYAQKLFRAFANPSADIFRNQDFELLEYGYILPADNLINANKSLISLYDQYLTSHAGKIPSILQQLCSFEDNEYSDDLSNHELLLRNKTHLGQMHKIFPLSERQRISLSYMSVKENNDIFTVNGPPGTGKTDMLSSIIASFWIESAINEKFPQLLVASSTNNTAVTNILTRLIVNDKCSVEHWIPDFSSFGMYLTANYKGAEAEKEGYVYRTKNGGGIGKKPIDSIYSLEYRHKAIDCFLANYNRYFNRNDSSIKDASQFLHNKLVEKQTLLEKTIDAIHDLVDICNDIFSAHKSVTALFDLYNKLVAKKNKLIKNKKDLRELYIHWLPFKLKKLKLSSVFGRIPIVKNIYLDKTNYFLLNYHNVFPEPVKSITEVGRIIDRENEKIKISMNEIEAKIKKIQPVKDKYENLNAQRETLENQLGFQLNLENDLGFIDTNSVLAQLDQSVRYTLFFLATHYWEARWIQESEQLDALKYNLADRKKYWQIQAMLTPCFITTLHSGPSFFQYRAPSQKFEYPTNFIDLLIIDEAGQVMPSVAAANISLAKKVLLIGDSAQIEPVFKLPMSIDFANCKKHGICKTESEYETLQNQGVLCSGDSFSCHAYGNLIILGQRKSKFYLKDYHLPGMFLREHRRCAKEIISYCNELCYHNKLLPLTEEQACPFPTMGYAHIKGEESEYGKSRRNVMEAEAIVAWIKKNQSKILSTVGKDKLSDCIGIITPFKPQSQLIEALLKQKGLIIEKVGTVHALQGAEKPLIIFSPVYTTDSKSNRYFFDRSPNMLNVAVSRAKLSFIVFGDMGIFDAKRGDFPSSLLAKYLFSDSQNEIVDIIQPKYMSMLYCGDNIEQISTLEQHRAILRDAFKITEKALHIVSPFLTTNAIESDAIAELIQQYVPKISINIYSDPSLNSDRKRQNYEESITILKKAGANVYCVNRVHSKLIIIDNHVIIEGSFNWLSASRNPQYAREESSILYRGQRVSTFIKQAFDPIKAKIPSDPVKSVKTP